MGLWKASAQQPSRGSLPGVASGGPKVRITGPGRTVRSPGPLSRPSPSANLAGSGKGEPSGSARAPPTFTPLATTVPRGRTAGVYPFRRAELCARMKTDSKCPECNAESLYRTTTPSGGGHGPILLPQLGGFFHAAGFEVVTCGDCGFTRFFAEDQARAKLPRASRWLRI